MGGASFYLWGWICCFAAFLGLAGLAALLGYLGRRSSPEPRVQAFPRPESGESTDGDSQRE